jgi:hypothetical protein
MASVSEYAIPEVLMPPREKRIVAHNEFIKYLEENKQTITGVPHIEPEEPKTNIVPSSN